jgi:hypothetical protein
MNSEHELQRKEAASRQFLFLFWVDFFVVNSKLLTKRLGQCSPRLADATVPELSETQQATENINFVTSARETVLAIRLQ